MSKKNTRNVKRRLSKQKIFNAISAGFFLACCIFYGSRFIKLYLENQHQKTSQEHTLAKTITDEFKDDKSFKNINGDYYFTGDTDNNYVMYSNMLWRIVKINNDNTIKLISDDIISYLAYGKDNEKFKDSYINSWLNNKEEENAGILLKELDENNIVNDKICLDNITKAQNTKCKKYDNKSKLGLLSVEEYLNAGGSKSYLNKSKNYYLSSVNNNEIWYVSQSGKLKTDNGENIYGIRPTITLKSTAKQSSGKGSKTEPYKIDTDKKFASFVKLGNDLYRVYETNNNTLKLALNDYLKEDNEKLEYAYSNKTYYHNDTDFGSLAYYLNHKYLNNLDYKDKIITDKWANGVLNENLNYESCLNTKIDTKVATLSIGNIILNDKDNYFLMNGSSTDKTNVFKVTDKGTLETTNVDEEAYIIPTISISQEKLTKGNGTESEPYEMEE